MKGRFLLDLKKSHSVFTWLDCSAYYLSERGVASEGAMVGLGETADTWEDCWQRWRALPASCNYWTYWPGGNQGLNSVTAEMDAKQHSCHLWSELYGKVKIFNRMVMSGPRTSEGIGLFSVFLYLDLFWISIFTRSLSARDFWRRAGRGMCDPRTILQNIFLFVQLSSLRS